MKIITLDDAIGSRGAKVLAYGASGSGKTTLTASLPGRKLVGSAELGLLSLDGATDIDVVEIHGMGDARELLAAAKSPTCAYDWIVLDSITEIAEVLLADRKESAPDNRQAYDELQDEIGALLRGFRGLRMGVYATAKELREQETEGAKRTLYRPMMPGRKLGPALPYVFDYTFRLVVDGDARYLMTRTDGRSEAKDRSGKLDRKEPADLGHIIAKVKGEKKESST